MTVCVCVKVNECMVFAADSATTLESAPGAVHRDGEPIQQVYRHGNKVFQLHRQYPIMAMTAGMGNFGSASIAMLAKGFRHKIGADGDAPLGNEYTMEEVAKQAHAYLIEDRYSKLPDAGNDKHGFEFWIGGYSSSADLPELWKLSVAKGKIFEPTMVAGQTDAGIWPSGQPDPIYRLIYGFGFRLEGVLMSHGVTPKTHAGLYQDIAPELYLPLAHPVMPIQDAIDLAHFLADMTKKVFRFRAVPEYVSGDIDIATVTKFERFRWINRKHYYPQNLNVERHHG